MKPSLPVILNLFLCLWLFTAAAIETRASTLTVTKIEDTNDGTCDTDCSLREAVAASASGDTVVFSPLFNSPQTITLTLGQITIDKNLTITGTGQNLTTISGNNANRIFDISGGVNVNVSGATFRDGNVSTGNGGAIRVVTGTLTVSNATFTNNTGSDNGAVISGFNNTVLTLSNLVVTGNFSPGDAIGGYTVDIRDSLVTNNSAGGVGTGMDMNVQRCVISDNTRGGVGAGGKMTISDSTIRNNTVYGVFVAGNSQENSTIERCLITGNSRNPGGGGVLASGTTIIKDSQIKDNTANNQGGGIVKDGTLYLIDSVVFGNRNTGSSFGDGGGGGILTYNGSLFVINSTISGNIASGNPGAGGGILVLGNGRVDVVNSTITNNASAGAGGGMRNGLVTFSNSIVAGNNSTGTAEEDVSGSVVSNGINLIGNTFGSSGWIASDLLNVNPMLGPLANNGGPSMSHALFPGSPAINAGNNAVAVDPQTQMPLTTDQRGFLRFYSGTVDIGAFEVQPVITGTVTYGNATGSPTPRFVSGVLLSALGSPNLSVTSRSDGTYTLGGFGGGAYTVTPSKTGGANGISSFDAGLVAKHVAGLQVLTGNQLVVADVSGNGTLSSFDAGEIARYTVGVSGFGSSGNWIFVPANRTYSSVNSTLTDEDFVALLMGDVSGNWVPGNAGGNVTVKERTPGDMTACSFTFAFPPATAAERQECEGPVGNRIVTTAAMCTAFAEARADAMRVGQNRLRKRAASLSGSIGRHLTEAVPTGAATGGLVSADRYPIMARKNLRSTSTIVNSDTHREIDRLIGESLLDYSNRREMEDMRRAKAKARVEEELLKCLPKEGGLPNWADDWLANVWQDGKSSIPAINSRGTNWIDPGDPNVMWRWDNRGWLSKTVDGGLKWDRLPYTYERQWKYISDLAIARENGKTILLAGVMSESFSVSSDRGIMRSDDGGNHWYQVCEGFAALSVAFDPNNSQNAIAEIVEAPDIEFGNPFPTSSVVFSTDGGKHWMTATRNGVAFETNSESKMRELAVLEKQEPNSRTIIRSKATTKPL